jgi:hypothetical protein
VVGAFKNSAAQEQAFNVIPAVKVDREFHYFVDGETCAFRVAAFAVDAIRAVEDAVVGEQDLQKAYAAAVLCVRMADAIARIAQPFVVIGAIAPAAAAGNIVLGGIREDGQFIFKPVEIHGFGSLKIHRVSRKKE